MARRVPANVEKEFLVSTPALRSRLSEIHVWDTRPDKQRDLGPEKNLLTLHI